MQDGQLGERRQLSISSIACRGKFCDCQPTSEWMIMSNWLPRLLGSTRDAAWREGAGATVRAGGYATLLLLALSIAGLGEVAHAANAKAAG